MQSLKWSGHGGCARALMAAVMTGSTSRGDAACPAYLQNGAAVRTWSSS